MIRRNALSALVASSALLAACGSGGGGPLEGPTVGAPDARAPAGTSTERPAESATTETADVATVVDAPVDAVPGFTVETPEGAREEAPEGEGADARYRRFGAVFFEQIVFQDELFVSGSFYRTDGPRPGLERPRPDRDVCLNDADRDGEIDGLPRPEPDTLPADAGDVLTVRSPAGSYTELTRRAGVSDALAFYSDPIEMALPLPVPDGLRLDLPGAEFPAFADLEVPDVEPLALPVGARPASWRRDSELVWVAGTDPTAHVFVNLLDTDGRLVVTCRVIDDGAFRVPEGMRAGDTALSGLSSLSRRVERAYSAGDAIVYVESSSSVLFGF